MGNADMTEQTRIWKKRQWIALVALLAIIAIFLFSLFYFGSRV